MSKNEITFIRNSRKKIYLTLSSSTMISLLDNTDQINIFEFVPRLFILTTNNSSGRFNIDLLINTSSVIKEFIKNNPNSFEYHLDINDEGNVLKKFEQMYQNKLVFFEEDELPTSKKITKILNIISCPNYLKPESLKNTKEPEKNELIDGVCLNQVNLMEFLSNSSFQSFTIATKNNEYKCNRFGIFYSKTIRDIITQNPTISRYEYDNNDLFHEFQPICDLFNLNCVEITVNNVNSIKEISEDFQIESIYFNLNKMIENYEKVSKKIDEQQTIIDSIESLFDLLNNIEKLTVDFVKNSIIEKSNWIKSQDNVCELAAIILQIINTNSNCHSYLIELLILLDKEANDSNSLNVLIPFIIKKVLASFGKNLLNCAFVYNLYKRGMITKDEIKNRINIKLKDKYNSNNKFTENIYVWFLPEIIEADLFNSFMIPKVSKECIENDATLSSLSHYKNWHFFLHRFYPNDIELYKKMRDEGEPDDLITRSLRNDDVDTLQSILSKSKIDITKDKVPFNMFEKFVFNGETNYLNYAAAYGSIKCFKYLLLNHAQIDKCSFRNAVFGGNIEIIKIVDQQFKDDSNNNNFYYIDRINSIRPSIVKHQNKLFDWILEHKFSNSNNSDRIFNDILYACAKNGNAHAFIEIVDKGIDFSEKSLKLISKAAKKGFYHLFQLIWNFSDNKIGMFLNESSDDRIRKEFISSFTSFGNLSIFKLSLQLEYTQNDFELSFLTAIQNQHTNIIEYFFDNIIKNGQFKISQKFAFQVLNIAIEEQLNKIFVYLLNHFRDMNSNVIYELNELNNLLVKLCQKNNFELVEIITKLIIEFNSKEDFTKAFFDAAKLNSTKICKYFLNQKVYINFEEISSNASKLGSINKEIFINMIDYCENDEKKILQHCFFDPAIKSNNKELIEYFLNENIKYDNLLIEAVYSNNLEIVNLILNHKSHPYSINRKTKNGTALHVAVKNNNLQIVNRLLSIEGINIDLYDSEDYTPLILAVKTLNLDIFNAILDFYGDDIQKQQIDNAIKTLLNLVSSNYDSYYSLPKVLAILKRILEIKNIDPNCCGKKYSLLSFACKANEIDIVKMLFKTDKIDLNAYSSKNGNTPLMIAIENKNVKIAEMLINDQRTDINIRNYNDETALTIAAKYNLTSVINLIIKNEKFNPDESNLNYAFFISTGESSKILSELKSLDVNYEFIQENEYNHYEQYEKIIGRNEFDNYITTLTKAVKSNDENLVDLVINHPSFDKNKSQLKKALIISIKNKNSKIFNKLLQFENDDVNITIKNRSLLIIAVENCCIELVNEILSNKNFDPKKSDIYDAFIRGTLIMGRSKVFRHTTLKANYESLPELLDIILDYDQKHCKLIDINKLLPNGKSFFTSINEKTNYDFDFKLYTDFFAEHGFNFNLADKFGIYPLEYAILINSYDFVNALIQTNRIDLNLKFPNPTDFEIKNKNVPKKDSKLTTYLHLVIRIADFHMISMFLDGRLMDINITDDLDETPLMEACRCELNSVIRFYSEIDGVDYLHKNKNGEDALHIMKPHFKGKIENKDQYFKELMNSNNNTSDYYNDIVDDNDDDNEYSDDSAIFNYFDYD